MTNTMIGINSLNQIIDRTFCFNTWQLVLMQLIIFTLVIFLPLSIDYLREKYGKKN
jgi:uncharacterized protein (DUF486 family)